MTRVLGLVSFRVFPTQMGGQKGVVFFYKHLQEHLPVVLAVSEDNQETGDFTVERTLYSNKNIFLNCLRLAGLKTIIRRRKISLIIAEHSYTGWMGWLLHRSTGIPFLIHSHNIEHERFKNMHKWWWKLYRGYEGWIHRQAQHSFFISEEDQDYARNYFRVAPNKTSVITYGIEERPFLEDKAALRKQLGLSGTEIILLFNGTLDYQPNQEAAEQLADQIEPLLRIRPGNYRILITGNRAPDKLLVKLEKSPRITYAGFVDDVGLYYQAADLFINPVSNKSGVKTKLIEAIASHCTSVSMESGAWGIRKELCGDKLITVRDGDWNSFADEIVAQSGKKRNRTPPAFYQYYSWSTICRQAAAIITKIAATE